jgi:hypothetical protein
MVAKHNVVVKKKKLDKDLIAKAKDLSEIDMQAASMRQEQAPKQEVATKDGKPPAAQEFDEWE